MPKFKYDPRDRDKPPESWKKCFGDHFNFIFAYKLDCGEKFYEPSDILFPSSNPISERDLK